MSSLVIVPITLRLAKAFVGEQHRHHKKTGRGWKFGVGLVDVDEHEARAWTLQQLAAAQLVGVAMVGRPVAKETQNREPFTCEVNRTCTDGTRNANSMLYGAAWRSARGMGYTRLITYTEAGESGASLRAAGFVKVRELEARGNWAESTKDERLRAMRDPDARGGVVRTLWEIRVRP